MGAIHPAVLVLPVITPGWFLWEARCEPICGSATSPCLFCWVGLVKTTLLCLFIIFKGICCVYILIDCKGLF